MNFFNKQNELAFHRFEDVAIVSKILTSNGYACMITREENLIILNYVYAFDIDGYGNLDVQQADRNQVIFMSLDDYYTQLEEEKEAEQFDFENGAVQNTTPVELNENEFMHDELFK